MAEAIRMPLLSDTMKEGVIASWLKKVGDTVKSDDVLAEVETDKATMEVLPYVDGTLLYVGVEQGKAAKVNDIIAIVGKPGEDFQALLKPAPDERAAAAPPPEQVESNAPKQPAAADPAAKGASAEDVAAGVGATIVRMPLLSDTMKEGKIVAWHKKVGDTVKNDDVLAEVETDKATMEVLPYADGVLLHVGVPEGTAAKVNDIIAIVGKAGTDVAPILGAGAPASQGSDAPASSPAQTPSKESAAQPGAQPAPPAETPGTQGGRIIASPLAKRIAREKGLDLKSLKGSGDGGRIIKRDVDSAGQAPDQALNAPQDAGARIAPAAPGVESHTDTPVSQMRRVIAQRLSESKFTAPHFYLRMTVVMDNAMDSRKALNAVSPVKISFNDLIIKAAAMALRRHPAVNSSWLGDNIRQYSHVHIGSAVAIDEGLIVPVIKFADQKTLSQIAAESVALAEKARNKKLQPAEFTGNTFTISNLGMMDIDEFTAIINPPDACILAVGKIQPTPVADEKGTVVVRQLLRLTLSCDHRVVDGAVGARFLQTLKQHLENPVTMLV